MAEIKKLDKSPLAAAECDNRVMDYEYTFGWTDADRAMLEKLQSFIPDKVFDAHAHLHHVKYMPQGDNMFQGYGTADMERLLKDMKELYGDRKFRGLILPTPPMADEDDPALRKEMNAWMNAELYKAPDCVGAVYVTPYDSKEDIEALLTNPQMRGFKCYHKSAQTDGSSWFAEVGQYLPEAAWEVADERGMSITIHMVRDKALSDEKNMAYFKEMTAKYPNAKLILAHCARGFASWTTIEAVREMKGIPNLYYDMAAICDPATMFELIRQAGPDHVMWGSDYFIDRAHGRPINTGESFRWMYKHEIPEEVVFPSCKTVLESLLAFYQASLMLDLSKEDIEQVFYKTGCQLFGLKDE